MEVGEFVFGILMLIVTILSAWAVLRELKKRNFFAVAFAAVSFGLFGWYSFMTITNQLFPGLWS
ncbi:DUF2759 domain-containing protein [Alkalibacillus aidingensis]|uniref:DUF2759 domain-containing protein n=1 Tax=Alkalibacillus aidingensis TaxID=2747607 RepID=UPI0016603B27|nr:DUF2759 domain-containing protein [Alkalibacillus aidingensis]